MALSRRRFLESATVSLGAAHAAEPKLATRPFGRTGVRVPVLAFGSGSRFLMYKEEDKALQALNKAIDLGITYVDTAAAYGDGASEERVGKVMKTRRKEVFLASKINERDPEKVKRTIDRTFRLLQTDRLDVLHIHSLLNEDDLAKVESKGGVLDILRKLRDEKAIRFMGVTSHTNPEVLARALERHDFNCTQMALNAGLMGMAKFTPGAGYPAGVTPCFETIALPVANRKGLGVIAMKIFGQEKLVGAAPIETLIRYSLSLPVSACVLGMPKLEFIEQNVQVARSFKAMTKPQMQRISSEVSGKVKAMLDREFSSHVDA